MARVHAKACAMRHFWALLLSAAVVEVVFIIIVTEFVDPLTIDPIVASRLIPLDKGNGKWQMRH